MSSKFFRLSLMMFLHYAVWGCWLPVAGRYLSASVAEGGLGFSAAQIGAILGLGGSVGAIVAPFIGQFADRHFRTEHVLAVLLFLGGIAKWVTASCTTYESWLWLSIAYSVLFMPTLALSNSLALAHLDDRERQFPLVRVWGTIGWIAAAWIFSWVWLKQDLALTWKPPFLDGPDRPDVVSRFADALRASGIVAFVYAAYCFTLPKTPPKTDATEKLAVLKAFRLLGRPSFLVVFLASLPIAAIHQVYFIQAPNFLPAVGLADSDIGPAMTVGQFAEILVMAGLGLFLKKLGFRTTLLLGGLAYFGRYYIWSLEDLETWVYVASLFLHGFCYACFFATAYIYVDLIADDDVRHSAQTVFSILILGLGPIVGGYMNGPLADWATTDGTLSWNAFWQVLAYIGLGTAILTFLFFRNETEKKPEAAA